MSREELDALMSKHETGDVEKNSVSSELKEVLILVFKGIIFGMLFYTALGLLASYNNSGSYRLTRLYGEFYAGYGLFFTGIFYAISFFAGRGVFMGEMMRRAWTNKGTEENKNDALSDLRSFVTSGRLVSMVFYGTVFSFFFYFYFFELLFL